ncbi:hypothetical protein GGR15_003509 [Butyricimonas paravirosa]|uniref:Uncharacterized protein n=1 Tax=Butyricimonas paravirosa TaxID=1472417 RepID=A0A7X6BL73_9BACT|nr:hypothetical protein [Butyricimonas paravirosa]
MSTFLNAGNHWVGIILFDGTVAYTKRGVEVL